MSEGKNIDELLACPFCGGVMIEVKQMEDGGYAVFCNDETDFYYRSDCAASVGDLSQGDHHIGCGSNRGEFSTFEDAKSAWNTRA